jgi:hypothetical protein
VCASGQVCTGGSCHDVQSGCQTAADCGQNTECLLHICSGGVCGTTNVAAGTPAGTQTAGDCKQSVCDGNGGIHLVPDPIDVPVDGNECTADVCNSGVPSNPPLAAGSLCTGGTCDGNGVCVPA